MAELQHPLKQEMDRFLASLNELHNQFNLYFQGNEKQPPLKKRKDVEDKLQWIRTEVTRKSHASLTFHLRQVEARYQMLSNRWNKTMAEIESGAYRIPTRRK